MNKTVLLVDDSATLRMSVDMTLSPAGFTVLQAADGQQGLEALEKIEQQGQQLDMIISDVNMPIMDGITFIKKVKQTNFRFVPILVLTTEREDSKKLEGKKAGASGWLVKPFKPETLITVVRKFTRSLT